MKYYYLAASLPLLSMDHPPLLSSAQFVALCEAQLSPRDAGTMRTLDDEAGAGPAHPFIREWRDEETLLGNAIVRLRAVRLHREPAPFVRATPGFSVSVERAVAEAFSRRDPIERERAIDRFRWSRLDDLAGYDPFDLRALLAYALRLRLAERWANMNSEKGAARAEAIVARQPAA